MRTHHVAINGMGMFRQGRKNALRQCLLAATAGAILVPAAAFADDTPLQTASVQATGIETVVVTAEKREQNIQDVPASVSVLTGRQLEALHASSMQDWAGYVPGLVVQPNGGSGYQLLTLEGIPPLSAASEVRVYIDDTPVGSSSSFANSATLTPDLIPYDLDRVEVLRGPQGTLYGANSMAALSNTSSNRPILTISPRASVATSSRSRVRAARASNFGARSTPRSSPVNWACALLSTSNTRRAISTT